MLSALDWQATNVWLTSPTSSSVFKLHLKKIQTSLLLSWCTAPPSSSAGSSNRVQSCHQWRSQAVTAALHCGSPQGFLLPHPASPSLPSNLASANFVYIPQSGVFRPLSPVYSGPYAVLEQSPKSFKVDLGDRQSWADTNVFASSQPRRESILTTRSVKMRHH